MANFTSYKEASYLDVHKWLKNEIPLTQEQARDLFLRDFVNNQSRFIFLEPKEKTTNPLIRLTIIFFPFVWLTLLIGLPFAYIMTGRWGYGKMRWFSDWAYHLRVF